MTRNGQCPELLSDLAAFCAAVILERLGIDATLAEEIGLDIAFLIAAAWGGALIYIPKGFLFLLRKKYREIFNEFTGHNHAELAAKYGYSLTWIYRVIKVVRQSEIDERQGDLFEPEDGGQTEDS
jgi:Mor family transcriptional regulator